ncbi:MAG: hypothetical protein KC438_03075 [Thermomicrobiales bacterium]|nr:hypothetical protein [Thermomicrobiales bacterium]MCO5220705.1 hypothetical protein [Thermomicrobiales bacterium]
MDQLANRFIQDEPRRRIGEVLDVDVAVTRGWWVQPLGMLAAGQVLGRFFGNAKRRTRSGLCFTAGMAAAGAVHAVGHIVTARMVEAPMDTLLLTPIRTFTLYDDTGETISADQHRGRAIGGPVANITAGIGALLLSIVVKHRYLRFFGIASTFIGVGALVPVAGNDGEELFGRSERDSGS